MPSSLRLASVLTATLAVSVPAWAQTAVPRNGGSSTGSSSSSGSSSSGSSSSGSSSSGSSGSSTSSSSPSSSSSSGSSSTTPSSRSSDSNNTRTPSRIPEGYRPPSARTNAGGHAAPAVVPGGVTSVRSTTDSATAAAALSANGTRTPTAVGRTRGDRPASGVAVARPYSSDLRYVSFPFYGPWGYYYPWYGWGFNYGYGYAYYNPWMYPGTHWIYGRYGYWYDPFAYDPYAYGYYGSVDPSYGGGGGGGGNSAPDEYAPRMGSIRFRVDPKAAQIYIDGALVGTVDEFDGLASHLEIEAGSHELRLKAPGYEIYTATINVPADRTMTQRIKMKKQ